ncbi:MAG TPA: hypothetical protein P5234_03145 [Thermoanaerobaculaceae bacterium]|nr:hypothetical protein [Thermoanaerobaculaceae bacterium]HRS15226.1 hypothetical protein [Thermoanaerobaculaceae bacterium]
MPIFRVSGADAAGARFERRRFEAADETALRTMLAGHGVVVDTARRVALSRWPFMHHSWPILVWPLLAFFAVGAAARLVGTGVVLWAVHTERPLVELLAQRGQAAEAVVGSVRADRRGEPYEWAYAFEAEGATVAGMLQRGFGSIRQRRHDVTLAGGELAAGQRFPVTYLPGEPQVHVPGRVDAGSLGQLDAAVRTVLWQAAVALAVGLASFWMVRNTLLRLGSHYWLDDAGTVVEYARREPVRLRIDLEAEQAGSEEDDSA